LFDGDDTKLEAVYNSMHDLGEFTDPKNFKTYEELQMKLNSVLGTNTAMTSQATVKMNEEAPAPSFREMPAQSIEELDDVPDFDTKSSVEEDDEDTMSYFAKLANS
jgi:hypothetical protein